MVFFLEIYQFFFFFSKVWSVGEILAWDLISKWYTEDGCSEGILSTLFWFFTDYNMFDYSFSSYIICFKLSSYLLKKFTAVSRDTLSLLPFGSIIILWFLSFYGRIICCSYSSSCLINWSHCSWNTFSLLVKESIKNFRCVSINLLCCLSLYVSLNWYCFYFRFVTYLITLLLKILQFNG